MAQRSGAPLLFLGTPPSLYPHAVFAVIYSHLSLLVRALTSIAAICRHGNQALRLRNRTLI